MNSIQAVIFDMDGVILDSERICQRAWEVAAKEYELQGSEKIIKKCLGTNKADSIRIIKEEYGQSFDSEAYLRRTSEVFHEIEENEGVPLKPYAEEILKYLQSKYRIALASSTRKETVERHLTEAGVINYFETITTGDMVKHSKPDPEIYLKACLSINVNPENCVAVEDSPNGLKSAKAAGITPIMVIDTVQPTEEIKSFCNYIFDTLNEIKIIL